MRILSKVITGTVIGAGVITGWSYINGLRITAAELVITPGVSVQQLSWQGLTLRLDTRLKNPSKGNFSIKTPFIKLLYKDNRDR